MKFRTTIVASLAAVLLAGSPAGAVTHIVTQSGFSFSPDVLTINVGDTVQWNWTSQSHTVTNGIGLSDPAVGTLFDAPLNSFSPTFSRTFTSPGTVPYFCRPHVTFGMTGTVVVQAASAVDQLPARGTLALKGAPNPFNPRTVISYTLPEAAAVKLAVYDAAGKRVRMLDPGTLQSAGRRETAWDGTGDGGRALPAGMYVVAVEAAGLREMVKVTLVK